MNITVLGKNVTVTRGMKQGIEKEFGRLEKLVPDAADLKVTASAIPGKKSHRVEATLYVDGDIVRAECESGNLYDSINEASDVLIRRVKKRSGMKKRFENESIRTVLPNVDIPADPNDEPLLPEITRIKEIGIGKVSREEAAARMDLLGHSFHLFIDAETNVPAVVYKRGDGTVGVLLATR